MFFFVVNSGSKITKEPTIKTIFFNLVHPMDQATRIKALNKLGQHLAQATTERAELIQQARRNPWFTPDNVVRALDAATAEYLNGTKLTEWLTNYKEPTEPKTIAIVMAGNIPLVGLHDLVTVLAAGHKAQVKLSSKDEVLMTYLINTLKAIAPEMGQRVDIVVKLENFDAVIATGSDNTSRYFEYYFGKYPHIIRKNRNSVAVLTGEETDEQILALGNDVFSYFGLGCRNVSKIYVPAGYDVTKLLTIWEHFNYLKEHDKYRNNLDYNLSILMLNNVKHYSSEYLVLLQDDAIASRIATVHYQEYTDLQHVTADLQLNADKIQCVVSEHPELNAIPLGMAQMPSLSDYADNVDTLEFLSGL